MVRNKLPHKKSTLLLERTSKVSEISHLRVIDKLDKLRDYYTHNRVLLLTNV